MVFGKWTVGLQQQSLLSASGLFTRLRGEGWNFFTFRRDAVKKNNVFTAWEDSLKQGGSCGLCERAVASLLSSASQRSPSSAQRGTVLKCTTVQSVNRLRPSNKWPVLQRGVFVCVYECTHIGQCDRCWTAIVMEFNASWGALPRPNCNIRETLN